MNVYRAKTINSSAGISAEGQYKYNPELDKHYIYKLIKPEKGYFNECVLIDPTTLEKVSIDFNDAQKRKLLEFAFRDLLDCEKELKYSQRDIQELHKILPRIYYALETLKEVRQLLEGI